MDSTSGSAGASSDQEGPFICCLLEVEIRGQQPLNSKRFYVSVSSPMGGVRIWGSMKGRGERALGGIQ